MATDEGDDLEDGSISDAVMGRGKGGGYDEGGADEEKGESSVMEAAENALALFEEYRSAYNGFDSNSGDKDPAVMRLREKRKHDICAAFADAIKRIAKG